MVRFRKKVFSKLLGPGHIEFLVPFDFKRIAGPDDGVLSRIVESKEGGHIGRPAEIDQPCRCAMVLHQGQPLEIVIVIGDVIQKVNGFAFEDSQDAFFLFTPGLRIDADTSAGNATPH